MAESELETSQVPKDILKSVGLSSGDISELFQHTNDLDEAMKMKNNFLSNLSNMIADRQYFIEKKLFRTTCYRYLAMWQFHK